MTSAQQSTGKTYGNGWMHRWLIRILRVTDVRVIHWFAKIFVVPPTLLANRKSRTSIYRYFRHRHGYGKWRSVWMTYRNHAAFAEVVIDRFAMYSGKEFEIVIDNYELFRNLSNGNEAFIQLSSHTGNYELAGYTLRAENKSFYALVYGGEKESVMRNRSRMFAGNNIRMIPMADDMSHLFEIERVLAGGQILSMAADRSYGSQKKFTVRLLGADAGLPQGPFLLAVTRGVPVIFTTVMKEKAKRYRITIQPITADPALSRREQARALADDFAVKLEGIIKKYPEQWYNYFDFWT